MNERGSNMEDDERANPSEKQNDRRRKKYKSHKDLFGLIISRLKPRRFDRTDGRPRETNTTETAVILGVILEEDL